MNMFLLVEMSTFLALSLPLPYVLYINSFCSLGGERRGERVATEKVVTESMVQVVREKE